MTKRGFTSMSAGQPGSRGGPARGRRLLSVALLASAPALAAACAQPSQSAPPATAPGAAAAPAAAASPGAPSPAAATPAPNAAPAANAAATAEPPAAADDQEEATNDLIEHHRHHHHGGVTRFVLLAIDTLGVSPDQEAAVHKIQADLKTKLEPARAAEQSFQKVLADGVAAGKIDKAKVDGEIAKIAAATTKAQAASDDALRELHGVLNPPQRLALADKIEAHWHVWEDANDASEAPDPSRESAHIDHLSKELSLTPEQVEKVKKSLHPTAGAGADKYDRKEAQARIEAFAKAFSGDTFDAKVLHGKGAEGVDGHMAAGGAARHANFVEAVTPVLTPEQRTKFAEMLREHSEEKGAEGA